MWVTIACMDGERIVNTDHIAYVEQEGNRASLHMVNGSHFRLKRNYDAVKEMFGKLLERENRD